jgi:Arc/MetJ-type ribon-helix-helix transcriptional regulator
MVKMTFTLDDETVERLRRVARREAKPQSEVIREAIREYEERAGKLTEDERSRMLETFDRLVPQIPLRLPAEADAELREIRAARRRWGRGHGVSAAR